MVSNWLLVGIGLSINGIFTGLGSAIGSFFAQKYAIKHFEKLEENIRKKIK
jgi:hypothetical protein